MPGKGLQVFLKGTWENTSFNFLLPLDPSCRTLYTEAELFRFISEYAHPFVGWEEVIIQVEDSDPLATASFIWYSIPRPGSTLVWP